MKSSTAAKKGGKAQRKYPPSASSSTSRRRRKPSAKANVRKAGSKSVVGAKYTVLPWFAVWLLAAATLISLIFWGIQYHRRGMASHSTDRYVQSNGKHKLPAKNGHKSGANKLARVASQNKSGSNRALTPPGEKKPGYEGPPTGPVLGKVAIVIDDFGDDLKTAKAFLEIPLPITFSILPHLKHSKEIARLVASRGHDVILHLPMQPKGYPQVDPGPGALLVAMSTNEISRTLHRDLDEDPYIVGVNNHMGSEFTENIEKMKVVLAELRRRGLFFLDSYTSAKSIGYSLAQQLNMPCRRRDVFLDHKANRSFIVRQLDVLIHKAKIRGSAIGIGHPYPITLKVLKDQVFLFEKEKVRVVKLSELME